MKCVFCGEEAVYAGGQKYNIPLCNFADCLRNNYSQSDDVAIDDETGVITWVNIDEYERI